MQEQKNNTLPTVYKFFSNSCTPCKTYGVIWNEVEQELKNQANFISVDAYKDTQGLVIEHNINRLPTTVVITPYGGIRKKIGVLPKQLLINLILN